MKHLKQRINECFPTVLAMLSGVDVNKILSDSAALSPIQHSWNDYCSSGGTQDENVTATYRALARKYAPYLIEHCNPVSGVEIAQNKQFLSYDQWVQQTSAGRGAVLLASRFVSRPQAHIAAYENGLIYCGDCEGPMSAKDYWILMSKKTPLCPFKVIPEY